MPRHVSAWNFDYQKAISKSNWVCIDIASNFVTTIKSKLAFRMMFHFFPLINWYECFTRWLNKNFDALSLASMRHHLPPNIVPVLSKTDQTWANYSWFISDYSTRSMSDLTHRRLSAFLATIALLTLKEEIFSVSLKMNTKWNVN